MPFAGAPAGFVGTISLELLALVLSPPVVRLTLFLGGLVFRLGIVLLIAHRGISIGGFETIVPGRPVLVPSSDPERLPEQR